jgi:hypothetical protein
VTLNLCLPVRTIEKIIRERITFGSMAVSICVVPVQSVSVSGLIYEGDTSRSLGLRGVSVSPLIDHSAFGLCECESPIEMDGR